VELILVRYKVRRYVKARVVRDEHEYFKQDRPGRPGPQTKYLRKTRPFWRIEWAVDEALVEYDRKSDGMYPLLTNDRSLSPRQVLLRFAPRGMARFT
jgi:hypothetical protein